MGLLIWVFMTFLFVLNVCGNYEQLTETKWKEYSDLNADDSAFDKALDNFKVVQLSVISVRVVTKSITIQLIISFLLLKANPAGRHSASQNFEVIDYFFNSIKKVVKRRPPSKRFKNETNKGLDIKLESSNPNLQPTFGNKQDFQFIYLGTKWCGAGDIAQNKRDIGYFYLTDSCCRAHDLCPHAIEPQSSKFGLKNTGKFTLSHCDCDNEFHRCLKSVNTLVSKQIGLVYFNVLGPQCFKEDHPLKCTKQIRNRCVVYKKDKTQLKLYQWVDNKWF